MRVSCCVPRVSLAIYSLEWRLQVVTPMHFLQCFLSQTVLFSDDAILGGVDLVDEAHDYYRKYAEFFGDLVLQEYEFQAFRPSVVAAATLAAARKALGVAYVLSVVFVKRFWVSEVANDTLGLSVQTVVAGRAVGAHGLRGRAGRAVLLGHLDALRRHVRQGRARRGIACGGGRIPSVSSWDGCAICVFIADRGSERCCESG